MKFSGLVRWTPATELRRPWDRRDPRFLRQEPGECYLRRRCAFRFGEREEELHLETVAGGGFSRVRRATEGPFNMVLEARI